MNQHLANMDAPASSRLLRAPDKAAEILLALREGEERSGLADYLADAGLCVSDAGSLASVRLRLGDAPTAIVVVGASLLGAETLDFCSRLSEQSGTPVIIVGDRGDDGVEAILALEMGAVHFWEPAHGRRRLLAQIRSVLRWRAGSARLDDYKLPPRAPFVIRGRRLIAPESGRSALLTPQQTSFMRIFLASPEWTASRAELAGFTHADQAQDSRAVDRQIARLRQLLQALCPNGPGIEAVYGFGYALSWATEAFVSHDGHGCAGKLEVITSA